MPVSRIESICVVADLYYDLKTPHGNEKVIVAVPFDTPMIYQYPFYRPMSNCTFQITGP